MFCASLRKRPEWAAAVPILRKETRPWRETKLDTHDIAMPMPKDDIKVGVAGSKDSSIRFILLSAVDIDKPVTLQRLERLFYLDGGCRCAIVFLLSTNDGADDGPSAFGKLQIETLLKQITMPILPLASLDDLPMRLEYFYTKALVPKPAQPTRPPGVEAQEKLLPYCSGNPPLPEHATHVLSDINTDFRDLVDKISSEQGRAILHDYAEDVVERVVNFWTRESA
ncbi:hypothetical protein GE09DRAFT_436503 [Coniochaeta sp. 2T2.1]|nr:hypothetical protein GE09DRAFT_436503 [Coniochaeta sp. 2T2.1]